MSFLRSPSHVTTKTFKVRRNPQGYLFPSVPPVSPAAQGSIRHLGRDNQIRALQMHIANLGPIVTPDVSIYDAIATLPKGGGRLILSEGNWVMRSGITTTKKVHIYAACPGATRLVRDQDIDEPMITLANNFSTIHGVTFVDSDDTNLVPAVKITGDYCTVDDCTFENVGTGVEMVGSYWNTVSNCIFQACEEYGVSVTGSPIMHSILNNKFILCSPASGGWLNMASGVDNALICGNVFDYAAGTIVYTAGNNQTSAEIESCNAVKLANITRS